MDTNSAVSYACPNCGAGLTFDPEKQKFTCEFCLSEFDEEELISSGSAEQAKSRDESNREYCDSMNEYYCPNCGAEIAADSNTAADFCYFCHSPVVLKGKLEGQLKPDKIIPFKFDKEQAESQFLKFARKKLFVPKDFSSQEHAHKISGVYYPFWVTDADTSCTLDGKAKRIRVHRQGQYEVTETSSYNIVRAGDIHFEDITSSAFSESDKNMLEGILPFPPDSHIDFSMPYLLGFCAKKRDIERSQLSEEVKQRMNRYASTLLSNTVEGYSSFAPDNCNVNIKLSHWEYTLMPVWVLTYKNRKGKIYTYAMNGYTGKIYGELPLSFAKLSVFGGIVLGVCTALFSLIGGLL